MKSECTKFLRGCRTLIQNYLSEFVEMILRVSIRQCNMAEVSINIMPYNLENKLMALRLKHFFDGLSFGGGGWIRGTFGEAFTMNKN